MVELSNFDIVCCKVPILISTVDDQGYLSNYSSFSLVFVEDLCTQYYTCQINIVHARVAKLHTNKY